MKALTKVIIASVFCIYVCFTSSFAADTTSKVYLARVNHLLENAQSLIDQAALESKPHTRIAFDYMQLSNDIRKVHQGIADYINDRTVDVNTFEPINPNYMTDEG
jgi:RAQPRD family integrative conjugative element protein